MEINNPAKEYDRTERKMKMWEWLEFFFTWILPFLFLILVCGHQYGAIFLIPMVIICLPGQIICKGKKDAKHEEMMKIWSKIGDIKSVPHNQDSEKKEYK